MHILVPLKIMYTEILLKICLIMIIQIVMCMHIALIIAHHAVIIRLHMHEYSEHTMWILSTY